MLSFSWNTPGHLDVGRALTWVVVSFEEVGGGTRVTLSHNGFGSDPVWDDVREYFRRAWRRVLRRMADRWGSADEQAPSAAVAQPPV